MAPYLLCSGYRGFIYFVTLNRNYEFGGDNIISPFFGVDKASEICKFFWRLSLVQFCASLHYTSGRFFVMSINQNIGMWTIEKGRQL